MDMLILLPMVVKGSSSFGIFHYSVTQLITGERVFDYVLIYYYIELLKWALHRLQFVCSMVF